MTPTPGIGVTRWPRSKETSVSRSLDRASGSAMTRCSSRSGHGPWKPSRARSPSAGRRSAPGSRELLLAMGRLGTRRLAFVVPPQATWSIAAYELALLTASERNARRIRGVEIAVLTHEASPMALFGPAAERLVAAKLAEAGVALRTLEHRRELRRPRASPGWWRDRGGRPGDRATGSRGPGGARIAARGARIPADRRPDEDRGAGPRLGSGRCDRVRSQAGRPGCAAGGARSARNRRIRRCEGGCAAVQARAPCGADHRRHTGLHAGTCR